LVVPAVSDEQSAWLVTLATWDHERQAYVAGIDGPLLESREEAFTEASRLTDWLHEHQGEEDLAKAWDFMHQAVTERSNPWTGVSFRPREPL